MKSEERIKIFKDVFSPKPGEKVLFLVDTPHGKITDSKVWRDRREMALDWFDAFKEMGSEVGFSVDWMEYKATGAHNAPIPQEIKDVVSNSNLAIAMTQYSASSSLLPISASEGSNTRCASMPLVEKRMEDTAISADYIEVQRYAVALEKMLNNAIGAKIEFSTGDNLYIDLRYRKAFFEAGDCTTVGKFINFPSGEACKAPYESTPEEVSRYGESKTEGILPTSYDGELIKFVVKNNRIVEVVGDGKKAEKMRAFYSENETRRNIAELGIGCNPKAVVRGNLLEDEKVGLHIAYGISTHIGGKVKSDMHYDIIYVKGCPIEGTKLTLINKDGSKTELIKNSLLQYNLLK